jgi:hypothetical protein
MGINIAIYLDCLRTTIAKETRLVEVNRQLCTLIPECEEIRKDVAALHISLETARGRMLAALQSGEEELQPEDSAAVEELNVQRQQLVRALENHPWR